MPTLAAWRTDKQQNRNSTMRSRKYPEPFPAIQQQKTRLVPEAPAGYPPPPLLPLSGGQQWPPLFVFAAPCRGGRPCPPDLRPILFFLFWRKKRTAAPGEEKKENPRKRKCKPCRHHVTAQLPSLSARPKSPQTVTQRSGHSLERKKETADMELSPPRRKRNAAGFF